MTLRTDRMRLVPASAALVRAEIEDRSAFASLLDATVPDSWPPEILADALPWFLRQLEEHPDWSGWLAWYGIWVVRNPVGQTRATLVGSAGFTGPPRDGAVEIGYSVLPQFQRQRYASEMARALTEWALARPAVRRVIANTQVDNLPSIRLLCRLGFAKVGEGAEPNSLRFELREARE